MIWQKCALIWGLQSGMRVFSGDWAEGLLYNPNGTYMTEATNYYNGFIQLESNISMSGTYLIRIYLSENLDNGSIQRTALAGYYY